MIQTLNGQENSIRDADTLISPRRSSFGEHQLLEQSIHEQVRVHSCLCLSVLLGLEGSRFCCAVVCYCSLKSPLENTEVTESVAEGCVGVLLFLDALSLPHLSDAFTISNPWAYLEFLNALGQQCWKSLE